MWTIISNQFYKTIANAEIYNVTLSFANSICFCKKNSSWIKFVFEFQFCLHIVQNRTRNLRKPISKLYLSFLELIVAVNVNIHESFFKSPYNILRVYFYTFYCRVCSSIQEDSCLTEYKQFKVSTYYLIRIPNQTKR